MSIDLSNPSQFIKKKVTIAVIQPDNTLQELTGTVEAASIIGIAFKGKGRSNVVLYTPDELDEITLEPLEPKTIRQKVLKPVDSDNVRQHMADRHGVPLPQINRFSDEDAFKMHDKIDHTNLGHTHIKQKSSQEKAVEAASN